MLLSGSLLETLVITCMTALRIVKGKEVTFLTKSFRWQDQSVVTQAYCLSLIITVVAN